MRQRARPSSNVSNPYGDEKTANGKASKRGSVFFSPVLVQTALLVALACIILIVFKAFVGKAGIHRGRQQPDIKQVSGMHPFTPVPPKFERTFYCDSKKKINHCVIRAFRNRGWTKVNAPEHARVVYSYHEDEDFKYKLQPWQRYNHMWESEYWNNKALFVKGFAAYGKLHPEKDFYFNPKSFRMDDEDERRVFKKILREEDGLDHPWVLKRGNINQGKGITMLGPHTQELEHVLREYPLKESKDVIVQQYICNEDTWFGRKYDVRMFWLIASLDPLIVLYHDGYVRVGNANYDELDFANTQQHLTTHTGLAEEIKAPFSEFEKHVKELAKAQGATIRDPVEHIRNQFKEAVGETAAAFKDDSFDITKLSTENNFGFYGADFVIDKDLDAWLLEPQMGCGMDEDYDFRIEMHNQLYTTMVDVTTEIWEKQERGDPIFPLKHVGKWEIVYADGWIYKYGGYQRSKNKKSCELSPANRPKKSKTEDS